mmetsp:Transcript_68488/g.207112  ORF Transcript_68488/g.207112 Transcript_68488/m.207112 type:complete len:489 (-) Transcript_68488:14-1480(-)
MTSIRGHFWQHGARPAKWCNATTVHRLFCVRPFIADCRNSASTPSDTLLQTGVRPWLVLCSLPSLAEMRCARRQPPAAAISPGGRPPLRGDRALSRSRTASRARRCPEPAGGAAGKQPTPRLALHRPAPRAAAWPVACASGPGAAALRRLQHRRSRGHSETRAGQGRPGVPDVRPRPQLVGRVEARADSLGHPVAAGRHPATAQALQRLTDGGEQHGTPLVGAVIHCRLHVKPGLFVLRSMARRPPRAPWQPDLQASVGAAAKNGHKARVCMLAAGLLFTPPVVEVVVKVQHRLVLPPQRLAWAVTRVAKTPQRLLARHAPHAAPCPKGCKCQLLEGHKSGLQCDHGSTGLPGFFGLPGLPFLWPCLRKRHAAACAAWRRLCHGLARPGQPPHLQPLFEAALLLVGQGQPLRLRGCVQALRSSGQAAAPQQLGPQLQSVRDGRSELAGAGQEGEACVFQVRHEGFGLQGAGQGAGRRGGWHEAVRHRR